MTTSTRSGLTEEQKQQVRFWIHTIGCDLAACYSQEKNKYKERWGGNIINDIDYDTRLEQGWFNDGVAVICGQLRQQLQLRHMQVNTFSVSTLTAKTHLICSAKFWERLSNN